MFSKIPPHQILAQLRLSVLACGEALLGKYCDSDSSREGATTLVTKRP